MFPTFGKMSLSWSEQAVAQILDDPDILVTDDSLHSNHSSPHSFLDTVITPGSQGYMGAALEDWSTCISNYHPLVHRDLDLRVTWV